MIGLDELKLYEVKSFIKVRISRRGSDLETEERIQRKREISFYISRPSPLPVLRKETIKNVFKILNCVSQKIDHSSLNNEPLYVSSSI